MPDPGPWTAARATGTVRRIAGDQQLDLLWTKHAEERMRERGLIMSDVLHVLKCGDVYEDATPSKSLGLFKYAMESETPNLMGRTVRVICIPGVSGCEIKVVSVMWVDEG